MYKTSRRLNSPIRPAQSYELWSSKRVQLIDKVRFLEEQLITYANEIDTLNRINEKLERQIDALQKRVNTPEKYRLEEENRVLNQLLRKKSEAHKMVKKVGNAHMETVRFNQDDHEESSTTEELPEEVEEFNMFLRI